MARERTGFIVAQVWVTITYTDKDKQQHKISKLAKAEATSNRKRRLTDAEKHKLKLKHAKRVVSETIRELKRGGATECKGSVSTRILARVGYTDEKGKRRDVIRAAES